MVVPFYFECSSTHKLIQVSLSCSPRFLPSGWVVNHPPPSPAEHAHSSWMLPLPNRTLTLRGFARSAFWPWGRCAQETWPMPMFRPSCQRARITQCSFFFDPSHSQMSSSLRCVLNTAKETVNSLHLFPVWSRWGCGAFRQSSSRKEGTGVLEGGMGVISIMHLRSLMKNCLVQQKRSTREHALGRPRLL